MYKSKARAGWLAAALCMIILTACGKPQAEETNLIDISNVVASETSFRTTTVRRGTYAEESQTSGVVRFPFSSDLEWDRPSCRIEEICVQRGDHVAEGDVLIRFTSEESLLDLEEMQLKLDRLKEEYEIGIENWEEDIDTAERATWDLTSYAWVRADIEVQRRKSAYEQYCCDMDHQIEALERSIAKRQEEADKNVLKAPYEGVIDGVPTIDVGSKVTPGQTLISMHSETRLVVGADNTQGKFSYDQEVMVRMRERSFEGRIIAASNILPTSYRSDYMVIELDSEEAVAFLASRQSVAITVTGETLSVDNALLASRQAVILSGGDYFVQILEEGGAIHRRPVTIGSINNNGNGTDVWILEGVEEGDTLLLVNG
ncbi:MAG: hypothetical protein IJ917_03290 [Firmicutes bacterium]|nr:hypothetical protein [Bacillota bacterium]